MKRTIGIALGVVAATAIVAFAALVLLQPRSAPLPYGASPLTLRTQSARLWPPSGFGCPMALVLPIRLGQDGDVMTFADADSGERRSIVWPSGFSARLLDGRGELVDPNGSVLAREGDVISGLTGGAGGNGDILICFDFASKPEVTRGG